MIGDSNRLFAFRSIVRLSCTERQLHARSAWMLIGVGGAGVVSIEDRRYDLSSGGAVIGGPGRMALKAEENAAEWKLVFIEFVSLRLSDGSRNGREMTATEAPWSLCKHTAYAGELAALAERLFSAVHMNAESPERDLTAHMLIQQMLLWWLSDMQAEHEGRRTAERAIRDVRYLMERQYTEALTREYLAGKAALAPAYFSVAFKKLTGMRPSVYLERLRVHRAAELLLEARGKKGNLAEIAAQCGFQDTWYMSKRFCKMQGMSPSAYRSGFVPERVASLKYPYTYHLLALGIMPTAARFSGTNDVIHPEVRAAVAELPALLSLEGQKQLLRERKPQAIVTYDTESVRDSLRDVAPVIHIPWLSMSWREHITALGRLFWREAAAVDCIRALDRQAAQVRQQARAAIEPDTRISVFKIQDKRCYLYGVRDTGCIFYEFLGYSPHPYMQQRLAQEPNLHSVEITIRQMADFAGDLNFVILYPDVGEQTDFLRMNEQWRQFEIAAERRVIYLDYRDWLAYDPINISIQLQKIGPILSNSMH